MGSEIFVERLGAFSGLNKPCGGLYREGIRGRGVNDDLSLLVKFSILRSGRCPTRLCRRLSDGDEVMTAK